MAGKMGHHLPIEMSAGELRQVGCDIPDNIPDCATTMLRGFLAIPIDDHKAEIVFEMDEFGWVDVNIEIPKEVI